MLIRARAPLRLGLGGGGTDVSPYCDMYGGCPEPTIDMHAYTVIEPRELHRRAVFTATDKQETWSGGAGPRRAAGRHARLAQGRLQPHRARLQRRRPLPLRMTTHSDAPPGFGLGSSSTLVVSMIKAFVEWAEPALGRIRQSPAWPLRGRAPRRRLSGGRQDQYAATFGGFNFMEFHPQERVVVNPLRIKNWIVSSSRRRCCCTSAACRATRRASSTSRRAT